MAEYEIRDKSGKKVGSISNEPQHGFADGVMTVIVTVIVVDIILAVLMWWILFENPEMFVGPFGLTVFLTSITAIVRAVIHVINGTDSFILCFGKMILWSTVISVIGSMIYFLVTSEAVGFFWFLLAIFMMHSLTVIPSLVAALLAVLIGKIKEEYF